MKIPTISAEMKFSSHVLVNIVHVGPRSPQLSEENLRLIDFITFNSRLLLKSAFLYQQPKFYGQI